MVLAQRKTNFLVAGIILGFLAIIIALFVYFNVPSPYPLKFTSPQNVLREPPVFHLNEAVKVEATFNNITKQDVTFSATVYWKLLSTPTPKNYVDPYETINITLRPGCDYKTFPNHALLDVRRITQKLFKDGHKKVTWRIYGQNNIIIPQNGGSKPFETEEFSYVPDNVQLPERDRVSDGASCEETK